MPYRSIGPGAACRPPATFPTRLSRSSHPFLRVEISDHSAIPPSPNNPITLINLVNTSEGDLRQLLESHHVEGRGDGLLSSALSSLAEVLQGLVLSEPHLDLDPVTGKVNFLLALTESDLTVVTLRKILLRKYV